MKKYEIGDIVFVSKFSYDKGEKGQNHLFVIIDDDNKLIPIEYFGMLVSSHREKLKYKTNAKLDKTERNGLNKNSIAKCDYIYEIPAKNIQFKIGRVDIDDYIKFMKIYNEIINDLSKLENV